MTILDRIHLGYIWIQSTIAERKRWRNLPAGDASTSSPRVFYGFDQVPDRDQKVYGGQVKLQDLNGRFKNSTIGPNILYLISSALPHYPVMMAQRAQKAGAKLVLNQNGVAYPGWHGDGWERTNKPLKRLLEMADYVVYQSQFCKMSADTYLGACRHDHVEVLYNPVDTSVFCPTGDTGRRAGVNRVLVAGSHWSAYRIVGALEAVSKARKIFDNLSLVVAGRLCWRDDEQGAYQEVMQVARKLEIEDCIEIVGPYSQQQAPDMMRSCSLLLHTKYNDPCPRLVVEAMSCGLPVVYSATGGVPELVGDQAGYGIPGPLSWQNDYPPDPDELAIGIETVLSELQNYAAAARQRVLDKFDVQPWLKRHSQIFESVLRAD